MLCFRALIFNLFHLKTLLQGALHFSRHNTSLLIIDKAYCADNRGLHYPVALLTNVPPQNRYSTLANQLWHTSVQHHRSWQWLVQRGYMLNIEMFHLLTQGNLPGPIIVCQRIYGSLGIHSRKTRLELYSNCKLSEFFVHILYGINLETAGSSRFS